MITKLLPERKTEVLAALRSGEYRQGKYYLRPFWTAGQETWCCLGVFADCATRGGVGEWDGRNYSDSNVLEGVVLPLPVGEWLTGKSVATLHVPVSDAMRKRGFFSPDNEVVSLDYLNDNGYSFEEIADLIEEHL